MGNHLRLYFLLFLLESRIEEISDKQGSTPIFISLRASIKIKENRNINFY